MVLSVRYLFYFGVVLLTFILGAIFFICSHHWIDFSILEHYNPGRPSIVLDDEGKEWARFQLDRREPIPLERMPAHLIQAFIAAEDWNFFKHRGISYKGIIRSTLVNLYHGRKVQGASTITQQLVKLLFFDSQKTFSRKLKEQLYALLVEQQFTKEQILEAYLNHVYFGCGIYGVQAAAQRFWGTQVGELSVDQAASLAAVIRNPAQYCPLLCPLSCERRRNVILYNMMKLGFITEDEYNERKAVALQVNEEKEKGLAPHLKEALRQFLEDLVGKATLYTGGLTIQTTLNQQAQEHAEHVFNEQCAKLQQKFTNDVDGGLIAIDVKTGGINALVGGVDFVRSKFNRALQARRQLGSVFKPLVYAAAIEAGRNFTETEIDEPIEIVQDNKHWSPNNYNMKFNGEVTLAYALSHSNNIVTIKTLLNIGVEKVIALAQKCHLQGPFYPYPSLALGCIDATLKEAAGMFNVFANNGVYVEPHSIKWVKSRWGTKIWKHSPVKERVLASHVSDQVANVLELGLQRVRKWFANEWIDSQAISKTGTTNDSRTCWYLGSTPDITTAVYIGCDDNRSLGKNVYPLRTAFPIWLKFNRAVPAATKTFSYDPSLREVVINENTGKLAWFKDDEVISLLI